MYVDERVGDKPNETEKERDRERKREEEVRSVRKMDTCNILVRYTCIERMRFGNQIMNKYTL